jgi:hypothetical protein
MGGMASTGAWSSLGSKLATGGGLIGFLTFVGCSPLAWEREKVLGEELSSIVITGEPGSGLGSVLAMGEAGLLVGSEGTGKVQAFDLLGQELWCADFVPGLGIGLGWSEDGAWVWQRSQGITTLNWEGEVVGHEPEILGTAVDRCPDGRFELVTSPGASVSCSEEGLLRTHCALGECEVHRDSEVIGHTSSGSAVAWMDGLACWGDVELSQPEAGGAVYCADGWSLAGAAGEHLGSALLSGRVAGQFSKWSIPARARVLGREIETVWSVDRAAERSRLSLAEFGGVWAVGVSGYMGMEAMEGRVFILTEDATDG